MDKPKIEVIWAMSDGGTLVKIDGVTLPCVKNVELTHDAGEIPILRVDFQVVVADFSTSVRGKVMGKGCPKCGERGLSVTTWSDSAKGVERFVCQKESCAPSEAWTE